MAVKVQLLFGFPGENQESIEETLSLFRETGYPPRRFQKLTPLPGSAVYDDCVDLGIIKNEDQYLDVISRRDAGFTFKKLLLNLTEWSDQEYLDAHAYAEKQIRSMIGKSKKKKYSTFDRLRGGLAKTISALSELPEVARDSARLTGILSSRMSSKYADAVRRRYVDLSPLLPEGSTGVVNTDSDSWKGTTPEKIRALIRRYSEEGTTGQGATVIHDEWGEAIESRYEYR
jgi:hypothetical protein